VAIRITDPDPNPYRDTDKTCLGRGMHCSSASSVLSDNVFTRVFLAVVYLSVNRISWITQIVMGGF